MSDRAARPIEDLPSARAEQNEIAARLSGRRIAVFLDYDGTLAPIAPHPDLAVMEPASRRAVADLAARCFVAVVSGRDVEDVHAKVGLEGLVYAGSHGFDISGAGPTSNEQTSEAHLTALAEATTDLRKRLDDLPGLLLERKRYSLAIHVRQVAASQRAIVETAVADALAGQSLLRLMRGKEVFELQPAINWNKGKAVEWLIRFLDGQAADLVPIYIGDDTTDEDAFQTLADTGISIVVAGSKRETLADYSLADPEDVRVFIEFLVHLLDQWSESGEPSRSGVEG